MPQIEGAAKTKETKKKLPAVPAPTATKPPTTVTRAPVTVAPKPSLQAPAPAPAPVTQPKPVPGVTPPKAPTTQPKPLPGVIPPKSTSSPAGGRKQAATPPLPQAQAPAGASPHNWATDPKTGKPYQVDVIKAVQDQYAAFREGESYTVDPSTGELVMRSGGGRIAPTATMQEVQDWLSAGAGQAGQTYDPATGQTTITGPGGEKVVTIAKGPGGERIPTWGQGYSGEQFNWGNTQQPPGPGLTPLPVTKPLPGVIPQGGLPGVTPPPGARPSGPIPRAGETEDDLIAALGGPYPKGGEGEIPSWLKEMLPGEYQAGDIEGQVGTWAASREQTMNQQIAAETQQMEREIQQATEAAVAMNPYGGAPGGAAWAKEQEIRKRYADNWANMRAQHTSAVGQYRSELTESQRQEGQQYGFNRFQAGLGMGGYGLQARAQNWTEIAQAKSLGQEDKKIDLAQRDQGFQEWAAQQGLNLQWAQLNAQTKSQAVDQWLNAASAFGQAPAGANQFGIQPGTQTTQGWVAGREYGPGGFRAQEIAKAGAGEQGLTAYQTEQLKQERAGLDLDRWKAATNAALNSPEYQDAETEAQRQAIVRKYYTMMSGPTQPTTGQTALVEGGWLSNPTAPQTGGLPGVKRKVGGKTR